LLKKERIMKVTIDGVDYVPATEHSPSDIVLQALDVRFDSDAGDNLSIRDYLHNLLWDLWSKGEGFSSKRPFGNSGWEADLYTPLVAHGFVAGSVDEDGYIEDIDREAADDLVFQMIDAVFYGVKK
jgi:hypothetical protein